MLPELPRSNSPAFSLNAVDWKKIGIIAAVAVVSAVSTEVSEYIAKNDFGVYTPFVTAGWMVVLDGLRRFVTANTPAK